MADESFFLMCDYSADPVWAEAGPMLELDSLPLSEELKADLRGWAASFEETEPRFVDEDSGRRLRYFDSYEQERAFEAEGVRLWLRARAELPARRIGYHSQLDGSRVWSPAELSPAGADLERFESRTVAGLDEDVAAEI